MRRFLIGTVAALALSASAAAPAQAHHDAICTEAGPPICVTGVEHDVDNVRTAAWNVFTAAFAQALVVTTAGDDAIDELPEPVCAPPLVSCVSGLRNAVKTTYVTVGSTALGITYFSVCTALGRPVCT